MENNENVDTHFIESEENTNFYTQKCQNLGQIWTICLTLAIPGHFCLFFAICSNFACIWKDWDVAKVRQTRILVVTGAQSHHLRYAKTLGFTGYNCKATQLMCPKA